MNSSDEWSFPQPAVPHSRRRHSRRKQRSAAPALLLVLLLLLGGVGGGVWWYLNKDDNHEASQTVGAAKSCTGEVTTLTLKVDPTITEAVKDAAKTVADRGNGCDKFEFIGDATSSSSAAVTKALQEDSALVPADVWIPESNLWVQLAAEKGNKTYQVGSGQSLARSPLILAMPEAAAVEVSKVIQASTSGPKMNGWAGIFYSQVDPRIQQILKFSSAGAHTDTSGMLTVMGLPDAMNKGQFKTPAQALMATLRLAGVSADRNASTDSLLEGLKNGNRVVFPVTEQRLWKYTTDKKVKATTIYPDDNEGTVQADYPLLKAAGLNGGKADLIRRLTEYLSSTEMTSKLTERGLRPAAGNAVPKTSYFQLKTDYTANTQLMSQLMGSKLLDAWEGYEQKPFNVLALIDQSGTMRDPISPGSKTTKAQVIQQAAAQAGLLFGDETSLGVWVFGRPNDASNPWHTVAIPLGEMNQSVDPADATKSRRAALAAILEKFNGKGHINTPLYETILEGYDYMLEKWNPQATNLVVVLSDGDEDLIDDSKEMSIANFNEEFAKRLNSSKPLPLFAIGYGAKEQQEFNLLETSAKKSGGAAVASKQPSDLSDSVAKVFLQAHDSLGLLQALAPKQ